MQELSLQDRYRLTTGTVFLTGIHAIVRFLLEKQWRDAQAKNIIRQTFIAGYEGSPLGGLDLEISLNLDLMNEISPFVHQPSVNEKTAAAAIHGSQYSGNVDGFWYGKAHGVKWALDEFSLANIAGTGKNSGVVLFAGDDHMAKSSGYPASSENSLRDARIPIFYPATVAEVIQYGHYALALSRYAGIICALKLVTPICDGAETVDLRPHEPAIKLPPFTVAGNPYRKNFHPVVISTASIPYEEELVTVKLDIAEKYALTNRIDIVKNPHSKSSLGIITMGKNYADVIQALRFMRLEEAIPVLKIGMIYPANREAIRNFSRTRQVIIVIEEKGPFIEDTVARALVGQSGCKVYGKRGPDDQSLIPAHGELNPDILTLRIGPLITTLGYKGSVASRIQTLKDVQISPRIFNQRSAHYCPGCPHSISAGAPSKEISGGEIGCSSLDAYIDAEGRGVKWIPTMGLGGAINNGIFPFNGNQHLFQNIGDGTILHSGLITLFSSISHGANITYKILWNHVVAMTGGQDITGQPSLDDFCLILLGMGVHNIVVVSKYPKHIKLKRSLSTLKSNQSLVIEPRHRLNAVQKILAQKSGVKVLIYDQECATEKRRRNKKAGVIPNQYVFIHDRVCENCGDCGRKSMCLALGPLETKFDTKTEIIQSTCTQDLSCIKGDCPSFVSVTTKGESKVRSPDINVLKLSDLDEPADKVIIEEEYAIYLVGIGGTGIVTLAHILGYAALFEGKKISEMNRTGLAQKGGPVESPIILSEKHVPSSSFISAGKCDLYLAADILGAVKPDNLRVTSRDRTVAIVNTSLTYTAKMVYDPQNHNPNIDEMIELINQCTQPNTNIYIDIQKMVTKLFDNHLFANIFQLGLAYQTGRIPLRSQNIEKAIRLNGQAIDSNIQAFRWGRLAASNPSRLKDAVSISDPKPEEIIQQYVKKLGNKYSKAYERLIKRVSVTEELYRKTWVRNVGELILFQGVEYAERYVEKIIQVVEADTRYGGEQYNYLLSGQVAFILHKLMAYKDEYEVARLLTDPDETTIETKFDGQIKVSYHLHPPFLRALGLQRKLRLGPWFRPILRMVARCKGLRGTIFDPFGHTSNRREERELITWYENIIDQTISLLTTQNYSTIAQLLSEPREIRGYEQIKHLSVVQVKKKVVKMLETLRAQS